MAHLGAHACFFLAAFVVAWLVPLVLIFLYHLRRVPVRLAEIEESFLREDSAGRRPVEHYVRLFAAPKPRPSTDGSLSDEAWKECIKKVFDRHHSGERYWWSLGVLAVVSGLALWTIWAWLFRLEGFRESLSDESIWALTGAYVWSLYEIQVRRLSNDLTPMEIFWTDLRYMAAIPVGYCVALLVKDVAHPAIAFSISAFPLNDIRRLLRRNTLKKIGGGAIADDHAVDGLLSTVVEGIPLEAVTRLEELDVTTYTSLAYADPIKLMAKTGYPLRLIVQWTDHALLAIYAPRYKRKLVSAGLPCSLDVKEFFLAHFAEEKREPTQVTFVPRPYNDCPAVKELVKIVGLKAELLNEIFQRVWSDPHVVFLDTLWYTGYPEKCTRALPPCPHHKAKG